MAWQLLAAALPAAAKTVGTYLNKPDQKDYKPQTGYMKKYLSYLRGRQANNEVMNMAMQPQIRAAGQQGRQMQQQVGYDVAKTGLSGSGIEAQMRLSTNQQTQQALSSATDKAVAAQGAENARLGDKAAELGSRIGAEEERSAQAFTSAKGQWKKQLASDVISLGANVASAGIQQGVANKGAYQEAVTSGTFEGSYDDFKTAASAGSLPGAEGLGLSEAEVGRMSPSQYASSLGARKQQISGLKLAEKYMTTEGVKRMMDGGMTVDTIISEANASNQRKTALLGAGVSPEKIESYMTTIEGQSIFPGANMAVGTEDSQELPMDNKIANLPEDDSLYIDDDYQEAATAPGGITVDSPVSPEASQMLKDANEVEDIEIEEAEMVPNVDLNGDALPGGVELTPGGGRFVTRKERMRQLGISDIEGRGKNTKPVKETVKPVKETVKPVTTGKTTTVNAADDVSIIRKNLVAGNYPIINITEKTGRDSVLAKGAKVRMAEPMANKFLQANNILKDKGIQLDIGDSFVRKDVKQESYDRWVAGGKIGAKVAPAERSFHTIGFAFDLDRTNPKMNSPEIAKVLKSVGLTAHEDEWWHWSLEEV